MAQSRCAEKRLLFKWPVTHPGVVEDRSFCHHAQSNIISHFRVIESAHKSSWHLRWQVCHKKCNWKTQGTLDTRLMRVQTKLLSTLYHAFYSLLIHFAQLNIHTVLLLVSWNNKKEKHTACRTASHMTHVSVVPAIDGDDTEHFFVCCSSDFDFVLPSLPLPSRLSLPSPPVCILPGILPTVCNISNQRFFFFFLFVCSGLFNKFCVYSQTCPRLTGTEKKISFPSFYFFLKMISGFKEVNAYWLGVQVLSF